MSPTSGARPSSASLALSTIGQGLPSMTLGHLGCLPLAIVARNSLCEPSPGPLPGLPRCMSLHSEKAPHL
eukprot:2557114-Heterocapsa_arctica.AAC.1